MDEQHNLLSLVVTHSTAEEEDGRDCNATTDADYRPVPPGKVQVGGKDGRGWRGCGLLQLKFHSLNWNQDTNGTESSAQCILYSILDWTVD